MKRPRRSAHPQRDEHPVRPTRLKRPTRYAYAQVLRFPGKLYLVTEADREAQRAAERIFDKLNGRCPLCHAASDKTAGGDWAISIQARHGLLTFFCRVCRATHEKLEPKLMRMGLIKRPRPPRESIPRRREEKCNGIDDE